MMMFNEFAGLAFNGKIMVVALHFVGIIFVILWARFVVKRLGVGLVYRFIAFPKQGDEKSKNSASRHNKDYGMDNPLKQVVVGQDLLGESGDTVKSLCLYHSSDKGRDNDKQHRFPVHIKGIVERLRTQCQSTKSRTRKFPMA